jgi:multiple sugar transport system substrate-binding protein
MPTPISRRRFLAQSALAAGAAVGAGALLDPSVALHTEAARDRSVTTLTVMYNSNELSKQQIQLFEQQNLGIKIRFLETDPLRLSSMMAAGQPPDFVRIVGSPEMPNFAARGLALNLDPYFATSKVLNPSQLMPINDVYRWSGTKQGAGPRYGMAKDWSADAQIWYNKKLFDQAGIKYPDETKPLSYDELLALGKKLTVRKRGKIQVYGLDAAWNVGWEYGGIIQMLAQEGKSLWNHNYTEADFTSPEVRKILKWYVDWAQARIGPSPLDPDPAGWAGPSFVANRVAMVMYGYWFQGQIVADTHGLLQHVGFLPAPQWGSKRISGCFTATGAWIPQNSKNHEAAWKFMEYYMAGKPAYDRATSGWGVPSVKKYLKDMPQGTPYQKDFYRVLQNELRYFRVLRFSPYVTDTAMSTVIDKHMEPVMKGQMKLDAAARQLQDAVNKLLKQGKAQVG